MLPCRTCAYRANIPGNAHIKCTYDWVNADADVFREIPLRTADINEHTAQWFKFPYNYDPVWGADECPAHAQERDPAKVAQPNPLAELLSMLH